MVAATSPYHLRGETFEDDQSCLEYNPNVEDGLPKYLQTTRKLTKQLEVVPDPIGIARPAMWINSQYEEAIEASSQEATSQVGSTSNFHFESSSRSHSDLEFNCGSSQSEMRKLHLRDTQHWYEWQASKISGVFGECLIFTGKLLTKMPNKITPDISQKSPGCQASVIRDSDGSVSAAPSTLDSTCASRKLTRTDVDIDKGVDERAMKREQCALEEAQRQSKLDEESLEPFTSSLEPFAVNGTLHASGKLPVASLESSAAASQ
ncbi:hypothetical protein RDI58_007364 [Solanum bulbocastanum]|uniref:Uncharacterized protein n=1 Tax=Solanum bulbocastanum TaxID=147425 RepID=A0AAN8U0T7_SOLBU